MAIKQRDAASLSANSGSAAILPKLIFRLSGELGPLKNLLPEEDISPLTMRNIPVWVRSEVKRQLFDSRFSEESAMCICIEKGTARLEATSDIRLWKQLSEAAIGTKQKYPDPEDFDEVNGFCAKFPFKIEDNHGEHYTRNLRMPNRLRSKLTALAPKLGITVSILTQILLIDGLRSQQDIIHGDLMDKIVTDFYHKLHKRLSKLAHILKSYEIPLCVDVLEVLQELGV
ncbi:MAG TPA: hypothetical protein VN493_22655 [Thermoanaerobaculia bacterium]|nr:hypothetical protein [Thermoanaerobaculia bacterium]